MVRRKQNFQTISWFWDIYNRNILNLDPPYQRRSVWTQKYKDYFVETILLGYPSPAIFLYEEITPSGITNYAVVDGKQRLSTIFEFVTDIFEVYPECKIAALRDLYFSEFTDESKRDFWSYQFSVEYVPSDDEAIINNIFDRINRNTAKLTPQELRHAKYSGDFITAANDFATQLDEEFPRGFPNITSNSRRQMKDVELVANLLLLIESGPRAYSVDQLDEEFAKRDSDWEAGEDVKKRFRRVVEELSKGLAVIPNTGRPLQYTRLRNQVDFYALVGAIDHLIHNGHQIDWYEAVEKLNEFVLLVDDDSKRAENDEARAYYEAARAASASSGQRKTRVDILESVLLKAISK